jgi:hypothetical protein
MGLRFLRVLAGILLIVTLPVAVLLSLVLWAITGRQYLMEAVHWVVFGE